MTHLKIDVALDYELHEPGAAILMIEAAGLTDQLIGKARIEFGHPDRVARVPAEEGIGERILLRCESRLTCHYHATVEILRHTPRFDQLAALPVEEMSGDALRYLLPSRFCEADRFAGFVRRQFGGSAGGQRVAAIRDWIEEHLDYVPGASGPRTSAADTFLDRRGVCRDYAHLMAAMCRASQIPARVCSAYGPSVTPQDFHAVVQVYLDGDWHLTDPTGMGDASELAIIAVGRDATDVAFLTTVIPAELRDQDVSVTRTNSRD